MLTRVVLFAASLAASVVFAMGLAMLGLVPAGPAAGSVVTMDPAAASHAAPPATQIDTTYVVPAPSADPTPSPIVIQRVVTADGEGEHGDD